MNWEKVRVRLSNNQVYVISIKQIYKSASLLKFEITGGAKKVILEKQLYRKTNKWSMQVGGLSEADRDIMTGVIDFLVENLESNFNKKV